MKRKKPPIKPPRVTPSEAGTQVPDSQERRSFLGRAWLVLGLATAAELGWIGFSFFRPRPRVRAAAQKFIVAGSVDLFPPGSVTPFPQGKFYLARLPDGGFLALSRSCTHLGCSLPWDEKKQEFVCPCHGSAFDIRGEVKQPPAPRALDLFPVSIENNVVRIDAGRPQRRGTFDEGQVARPL
jgi:cytochrome b6-f complex iron-sulfur subunit